MSLEYHCKPEPWARSGKTINGTFVGCCNHRPMALTP
jgi:hypothetical protein